LPLKLDSGALRGQLLERQQAGPRPSRQANPLVDRSAARLVERCLAYAPADRPQSAAALAADLKRCLSPLRRVRRWTSRHPRRALATLFVFLAALLAGGLFWFSLPPYEVRELNRGLEAYRQEEYSRAVGHFSKALKADPGLARALFARG